jgi:hypothetical protein
VFFGILFVIAALLWWGFLGKLTIMRYHGKRWFPRRLGFLGGFAWWPPKYDSLAVLLQGALLAGAGVVIIAVNL